MEEEKLQRKGVNNDESQVTDKRRTHAEDSHKIRSHTHRVVAASEHSQHGRSQLWQKPLGHLGVFFCECVRTSMRVSVKCGWGDWGSACSSGCSQKLMAATACMRLLCFYRRLNLWGFGTVLPSLRLVPPPSWLPWHRKEALHGVDSLIGSMSERSWQSLWEEKCHWPVTSCQPIFVHFHRSTDEFTQLAIWPLPSAANLFLLSFFFIASLSNQSNSCFPRHKNTMSQSHTSTLPPTFPALAICLLNKPRCVCVEVI